MTIQALIVYAAGFGCGGLAGSLLAYRHYAPRLDESRRNAAYLRRQLHAAVWRVGR